MQGPGRLTRPDQYTTVYNKGRSFADKLLVLKAMRNQSQTSNYGISVSKRVGNAVVRNKVKRRLREILRLTCLTPGWDIVLIARSPSAECDYQGLHESVTGLLSRAQVVLNK